MDTLLYNICNVIDTTTVLIGAIVFLLVYLITYRRDRGYKLPPGPPALPIIGTAYLHRASMDGLIRAAELGHKDAVRVYAGSIRAVLLNSYEAIKEAAITKAAHFSDRGAHVSYCFKQINPNSKGVINSDFHDTLRSNRSTTLTILRNLGVGRSTMEGKILEEARDLTRIFAEHDGKAFDPWHILNCSVLNVILYVTFNKRHEHTDPELLKIVKYTNLFVESGTLQPLVDGMNWLRYIYPFKRSFDNLVYSDTEMRKYMWKYAQQLIDAHHVTDNATFIDCWLQKNYDEVQDKAVYDEEELLYILRDFLIAGSETTTTSLKWTIIFVANRPEIQDKAFEEIRRVVGTDRQVGLNDRKHLPYIEALILEIQRFNTIVPRAIPHYTKERTTICGFDIPADTIVAFNLHAVHRNKKVFGDAHKFRPERFIDESGKFVKHPHVIPFGIGKRSCLGEILAVQELFLFTTALLQTFQFLLPDGVDQIDEKGIFGFTYGPKPFKIRAVPR